MCERARNSGFTHTNERNSPNIDKHGNTNVNADRNDHILAAAEIDAGQLWD